MSFLIRILSLLTLVVAFTRATITIQTQNLIGNTTNTVHWTSSDLDTDPESFTMELHHETFHHDLAVGNNVPTANMQFTFEMPDVIPMGGYSLLFVQNGNITNVIAVSGSFFIIENDISGPHTGLVSPTLPPPGPKTTASNTSVPSSTSTSTSTSVTIPTSPTSSSTPAATAPVVVIPNPSSGSSSGNSSIIGDNNPTNGAKIISIPFTTIVLTLITWAF